MKTTYIIFIFIIFISCKKDNNSELENKINNYILSHIENNKFNGNLFITKGDEIIFNKSYGYANREFNILNNDSTKFLIGSITKPFTAAAILILEKQNKLNLNDKLNKYFPDFPKADSVTIYQLLTHTSGITDYHSFPDWVENSKKDLTPYFTIERIKEHPYIFSPGERFSYTNSGYILLGLIIEKITNKTFYEFINEEIINKLNLKNTGIINNTDIINNLANGYYSDYLETRKADYINYYQPFASGNMYSNVYDLWEFNKAIFNNKLFSKEKTKEIFENNNGQYGYGWGIRDFDGIKAYGHWGGMNGFIGAITYIPEDDYFICFLTNDDNTPKVKINKDLVNILYDKEIEKINKVNVINISKNDFNKIKGDYLIKQGDTLSVYENNNKYYLKETAQLPNQLYPISKNEFALNLLEFNVIFDSLNNNKYNLIKFSHNDKFKAVRINEN